MFEKILNNKIISSVPEVNQNIKIFLLLFVCGWGSSPGFGDTIRSKLNN